VTCVWLLHIFLLYSHHAAVVKLPDQPSPMAPDGVVYQTTNYSCGPASLATLFDHYNIIKSEREWAELAGTGIAHGTSLAGLKDAGTFIGFEPVALNPTFEQLDLILHPAILFETREYHLVTFWGMDDKGDAILRDPVLGKTTMDAHEYDLDTMFKPEMLVYYPGRVPTCNRKSEAWDISRFQSMLASIGYYSGSLDGQWNWRMEKGIENFQAEMSLPKTGWIDQATNIYLEGACKLVTQGPPIPFMSIDREETVSYEHRAVNISTKFHSE
jgi:hypothetical protein